MKVHVSLQWLAEMKLEVNLGASYGRFKPIGLTVLQQEGKHYILLHAK